MTVLSHLPLFRRTTRPTSLDQRRSGELATISDLPLQQARQIAATIPPGPLATTVDPGKGLHPTDLAMGEIVAITGTANPGACQRCASRNQVRAVVIADGRGVIRLCVECCPRGAGSDGAA